MGHGFGCCGRRVWTSGRSEGRVVVRRFRGEVFFVIYRTHRVGVVVSVVREEDVKRAALNPSCEHNSKL
jgi:hypothetical protein